MELREQVANVRFDRLFREVETVTDLAVDEPVRDQLKNLDLAHGRILLERAQRAVERDDLGVTVVPASGDLVEAPRVIEVPVQDVFALGSVHEPSIGTHKAGL